MFNYMGMSEEMVQQGVQKFGLAVGARKMIDWQYDHAVDSLQSKTYITYWNESKKSQCSRLGRHSKCFCGHLLTAHNSSYFGKKFSTVCGQCKCQRFAFVPSRPEECGMYWLVRRKDFDVSKWKPPCKCKHDTADHLVTPPFRCKQCSCYGFNSNFACLTCDGLWQHHEVVYEKEEDRQMIKKPIGQAYLPLATHQNIQKEVFKKEKYKAIVGKSLPSKNEAKDEQMLALHEKLNPKRPSKAEQAKLKSPLGFIIKPKYPEFMLKKQ